jgi:MFS family permease
MTGISSESVDIGTGSLARGYPKLLVLALMLGTSSQGFVFTVFVSVLPQMARDLGPNGAVIAQMTISLAALGLVVGSLASGWILERLGTRYTMLASTVAYGLFGAMGLTLREPTMLLASRFLVGFSTACMMTVCVWGIAAAYEAHRRARVLGVAAAASAFWGLAGILLGGYLAQRGGWPLTFISYPAFGLAGFVLVFFGLGQAIPPRKLPDAATQPFFFRLLPFYLMAMLALAVMFMGSVQFPFMLEEDGMATPTGRAMVIGTITAVGTLLSLAYGWLERRLSALGAFILCLLSMSAALATIGWGSGPTAAITGAFLMGIYLGIVSPYCYQIVTERAHDTTRSRAVGILNAAIFLGGFVNPIIFAPLTAALGLRRVFLVTALVMAAGAVMALFNFARPRGARTLQGARPN